jgi:hypothetical protein
MKEDEMKNPRRMMIVVAGLVALGGLFGCGRETPAEQPKSASGNATTEAAGQALLDYAETPMDKARQTEGVLEQSAEQRADEINKVPR